METRGQEIITHSDNQMKVTRGVKPRHGKASVLLALVGQRHGLVFAGPLLAVIADCGDTEIGLMKLWVLAKAWCLAGRTQERNPLGLHGISFTITE